jgi:hypothetical protein
MLSGKVQGGVYDTPSTGSARTPCIRRQDTSNHEVPGQTQRLDHVQVSVARRQPYLSLSDTNKWGPAVINKDKQTAPERLISHAEANLMVQKAIADSKGGGGTINEINCYKCGKRGHKRSECTSQGGGGQTPKAAWKTKPPVRGQLESKTVDSMEWHWCAKCNHWRISHGTSDHKDDFRGQTGQTRSREANTAEGGKVDTAEVEDYSLHSSSWTCIPNHNWRKYVNFVLANADSDNEDGAMPCRRSFHP